MSHVTKKSWAERRTKGLCGNCGKTQAVAGRSLCERCKEAVNYSQKKYRMIHAVEISKRKSERYETLKEAGLCVRCGKIPPLPGKNRCESCIEYERKQNIKYREKLKTMKQYNTEVK